MNFLLTASGHEYQLDGPEALRPGARPILMRDIAHQLALINRFNGATRRPYSVAEHSLLVSDIAERDGQPLIVQLAALLHDAHEVYTTDLIGPVRSALNARSVAQGAGMVWREFEHEHMREVRKYFGVLTVFSSCKVALHRYDMQALATERRDLQNWSAERNLPWFVLGDGLERPALVFEPVDWVDLSVSAREAMRWHDWRDQFQMRFDALMFGLGLTPDEQAQA